MRFAAKWAAIRRRSRGRFPCVLLSSMEQLKKCTVVSKPWSTPECSTSLSLYPLPMIAPCCVALPKMSCLHFARYKVPQRRRGAGVQERKEEFHALWQNRFYHG